MMQTPTDWNEIQTKSKSSLAIVDPQRRMCVCLNVFAALLVIYFFRAIYLEASQGAALRAAALAPHRREIALLATRGRILSRDGVVLACQHPQQSLSVDYRFLEEPADHLWLRAQARKRLPKAARRDEKQIAQAEQAVLHEREECQQRLAVLCGLTTEQWHLRTAKVQKRVERMVAAVARAHENLSQTTPQDNAPPPSAWESIGRFLLDAVRPARDAAPGAIKEQQSAHVIVDNVPQSVADEITHNATAFPGVNLVQATRRDYPCGTLAAHVIGYMRTNAGITGVERQCEAQLSGHAGEAIEEIDHAGRVLKLYHAVEPLAGSDLALTLDSRIQRAAEELLDAAIARQVMQSEDRAKPIRPSGAIVVMDVRDGALWAVASAPRFAPAVFAGTESANRAALLQASDEPLFHRAVQMALPPGALFKPVTAIAMLESGRADPARPFFCQGYFQHPDRDRCAIFIQTGVGHGDVTMSQALAQGCNVYFQHGISLLPPDSFFDWGGRLGMGRATGVDLPSEAAGSLARPKNRLPSADEMRELAVGRGRLTVTPLQMARFMALLANGGSLVTPHVMQNKIAQAEQLLGLSRSTLSVIRAGMLSPAASTELTAVAGLTSDAWFAGYFPADHPRIAIVVAIEPSADAATTLCPVVRRMVLQVERLGLLGN